MSFLRRYALWIVLATVACAVGGWAIAARQPIQFTTAAAVDVEASVIPGAAPVPPNLATEQQVATSGNVVSSAASALSVSPSELNLSVTNKAGTNILLIACSEPTATAAVSCANAVAVAYRDYRNETGSSAAVRAHDSFHVTIVTPAPPPSAKASKRKLELLAVSVILGLSLGVGTAFLRDRLDDRVRDRADLERCLHAPVLGEIPALRRRSVRPESGVIYAPQSSLAEAYRHLRARISPLIASTDSRGKVLLVTSAQAGEGRTSVAINLAAVMAFTGASVLLVDADLRNQALSDEFRVGDEPGLTDLLADRARLGEVIKSADFAPGLSIMAAGTVVDRPADLFDAARLRRAFSQLTVMADIVIVDSGPLRAVSDPLALVPVSDIVIMVADVQRTRRAAVTAAVQDITGIGSVAIVGVLNRVPRPWKRDLAPVKSVPRTQRAAVTTSRKVKESESVTIASNLARAPQAWRPIPVPAERAAEPGRVPSDQESPPGDGEKPVNADDPTRFIVAEPSRNHVAGAAATGAPSNGSVSSNGSGPNEVQAAAGPLPPG